MVLDQIQAVYIHRNEVTYYGQPQSKALRRSKITVVDSWCVKDNFLNEYVDNSFRILFFYVFYWILQIY